MSMIGTKEHYDLIVQFDRQFKHLRLDKEDKEFWRKGHVYQDGHVNQFYGAFFQGYALGKAAGRDSDPAQAAPKPLDDPRLQELFSAAIDGALTSGYQGGLPAPAGHWLEYWCNKGAAVRAGDQAVRVQPLSEGRCIELLKFGPDSVPMVRTIQRDCAEAWGLQLTNQEANHG